jgi:hypothetical protein
MCWCNSRRKENESNEKQNKWQLGLEDIMLTDVSQRQILHALTHIWMLTNVNMNQLMLVKLQVQGPEVKPQCHQKTVNMNV